MRRIKKNPRKVIRFLLARAEYTVRPGNFGKRVRDR